MMWFSYYAKIIVWMLSRICWDSNNLKRRRNYCHICSSARTERFCCMSSPRAKSVKCEWLCLFRSVPLCTVSLTPPSSSKHVRLEGSEMWRVISMFVLLFEVLCATSLSSKMAQNYKTRRTCLPLCLPLCLDFSGTYIHKTYAQMKMAVLSLSSRASNWRTFATCLCCSIEFSSQYQFYAPIWFKYRRAAKECVFCSVSHSIYFFFEDWLKTSKNSADVCVVCRKVSHLSNTERVRPAFQEEVKPILCLFCSLLFSSSPLAQNGLLYVLGRDIWPKPTLVGHMCRFNCFYFLNSNSVTGSRCTLLSSSLWAEFSRRILDKTKIRTLPIRCALRDGVLPCQEAMPLM